MTKRILKGFKWCVTAAGLSIAGVAIVAYIGQQSGTTWIYFLLSAILIISVLYWSSYCLKNAFGGKLEK